MSDDHPHRILLHRGGGPIGAAIKAATRCQFTHGSLYKGGGYVLEAMQFSGVQFRYLSPAERAGVVALDDPRMSRADWDAVEKLMRGQLGKPYDYGAVLRFLGWQRDKDASNGRWFCFELLAWALAKRGFPVAGGVKACRIHGGHFEARIGDPYILSPITA